MPSRYDVTVSFVAWVSFFFTPDTKIFSRELYAAFHSVRLIGSPCEILRNCSAIKYGGITLAKTSKFNPFPSDWTVLFISAPDSKLFMQINVLMTRSFYSNIICDSRVIVNFSFPLLNHYFILIDFTFLILSHRTGDL